MSNVDSKKILSPMVIGTLGIVYGDIGTSPLYALKTCLIMGDLPINAPTILGLVSFFFGHCF